MYEDLPRDAPERRALREEILEGHKNGTLDEVCRRWVHQRMELLLKYADPSRPDISLPPTPGYQFRIEILELSFPIWRRFRVPAGVSFRTLHDTVQIVMGWENYHLYRFDVGDGIAFTDNPQGPGERYSDELIDEYLKYPGAGFFYEYDFGDRWDHMLVLEEQPPPVQAPECIVGACACPPEDCGGPQLYDEFVHSRKKRKGRVSSKWQHRMGNYWDADAFDRKQINRGLVEYWQSVLEEQEAEVESEAKKAE